MSEKRRPAFVCKSVRENGGSKFWPEIGAAWIDRSGRSISIQLDALPLPDDRGRVWLRLMPRKGVEVTVAAEEVAESADPIPFGDETGEV